MPTLPSKTQIALTFGGNDAPTATMTSIELVAFINAHRKAEAEKGGHAFPSKGFAQLQHKHFLEKVPEVLGAETSAKFSANLQDSYGRLQPAYIFPKREACLMAMSYSYAIQAAVFDHMTALEAQLAKPVQPPVAMPHDFISALEHLLESKKAEKLAIEQRDHAIATKSQISDRKTATAMATASAKAREVNRLKHELGFSARHATILQVEKKLKRDFDFHPLRRWCNQNNVKPETVPDKRYPDGVKAWPAQAWQTVYSVDLVELFGEVLT